MPRLRAGMEITFELSESWFCHNDSLRLNIRYFFKGTMHFLIACAVTKSTFSFG